MGPLGNLMFTYQGIQKRGFHYRKGIGRGTIIAEIEQVALVQQLQIYNYNNKCIKNKIKTGAGQDYLRTVKISDKTGFMRN